MMAQRDLRPQVQLLKQRIIDLGGHESWGAVARDIKSLGADGLEQDRDGTWRDGTDGRLIKWVVPPPRFGPYAGYMQTSEKTPDMIAHPMESLCSKHFVASMT